MRRSIFTAVTLAASFVAFPDQAATLIQDDDWTTLFFTEVGSPILDGLTGDSLFNFTVVGSGLLRITDVLNPGDIFQLTINGAVQAPTSTPGVGPGLITDGDLAFKSGYLSRGSYLLAAGNYTVTGTVIASPFNAGNAAIRLTTATPGAVPEPATWAMMIFGFGAVGSTMRYRRRKTTVSFA